MALGNHDATEVGKAAWIERELAKAGPLTQEQQATLRRILLGSGGRATPRAPAARSHARAADDTVPGPVDTA